MVNKDKIALHWKIVLALVLGVIIGAILQLEVMADWSQQIAAILKFGASIFLRLLKMVVVPLVASSLFVGVTSVASNRDLGKIGLRTAFYYITTSTLAIGIGLLMVNLIQPGKGAKLGLTVPALTDIQTPGSLWDILLRMIPTNPVAALAQFDMIGIIFFSILFAVFTTTLQKSEREPVVRFFNSFYKVMMKIVHSIIALAPYGVFCLIANLIATTGFAVFVPLFKYLVTVTLALAVHFFIILPLIAKFFAGKNPLNYLTAMAPALLTAFSSASSAATLPLTMECAEKRGAIPSRITHLVLPLGATVNMDGTALYEGVAVLFIAQALGVDLGLLQQATVLLTALLVSIGAAGIPHAGLVMMVIILEAVGLPLEATGMIWAVDRVVDMARTATNVWSDSIGAAVVAHYESSSD